MLLSAGAKSQRLPSYSIYNGTNYIDDNGYELSSLSFFS